MHDVVRVGQVFEQTLEVVGETFDLLLLALQGNDESVASRLNEERALPRLPEGARSERLHLFKLELLTHDGRNSLKDPPVEFTVSTTGPVVL